MVIDGSNLSSLEVVEDMFNQPVSSGQIRYTTESGQTNLGSYKKIPTGRLGIITEVNEDIAFEAIYIIQRRNILPHDNGSFACSTYCIFLFKNTYFPCKKPCCRDKND